MTRNELNQVATRVLGANMYGLITGWSDRQLAQALLHKLAPRFDLEGRSDAALTAALTAVLGSVPATATPQPRRLTDEEQRQTLVAQFAVLEQQRLDAWRPKTPDGPPVLDHDVARRADSAPTPPTERDLDAELSALEAKRQCAWRSTR